jgi:hypothetical protein
MKCLTESLSSSGRMLVLTLGLGMCGGGLWNARAQVTVISDPPSGATGIPQTNSVAFTFSAAMATTTTRTFFYSLDPGGSYSPTHTWNPSSTVLTCTPVTPFPPGAVIYWMVNGDSVSGAVVEQSGSFTTVAAPLPQFANLGWSGGTFGFEVVTVAGQTVTVVYSTRPEVSVAQWPVLLTTNSPGSRVRVSDPHSVSNSTGFYQVRNGL